MAIVRMTVTKLVKNGFHSVLAFASRATAMKYHIKPNIFPQQLVFPGGVYSLCWSLFSFVFLFCFCFIPQMLHGLIQAFHLCRFCIHSFPVGLPFSFQILVVPRRKKGTKFFFEAPHATNLRI